MTFDDDKRLYFAFIFSIVLRKINKIVRFYHPIHMRKHYYCNKCTSFDSSIGDNLHAYYAKLNTEMIMIAATFCTAFTDLIS